MLWRGDGPVRSWLAPRTRQGQQAPLGSTRQNVTTLSLSTLDIDKRVVYLFLIIESSAIELYSPQTKKKDLRR